MQTNYKKNNKICFFLDLYKNKFCLSFFRFIDCGWTSVNSWTMSEIYKNQINKAEISR